MRYEPVEVDPRRLAALAERLAAGGHASRLYAPTGPGAPVTGFVIANEVLDALPTHRLVQRDGVVREVRVGVDTAGFVDVETEPSTPALVARLADEGVRLARRPARRGVPGNPAVDRAGSGRASSAACSC